MQRVEFRGFRACEKIFVPGKGSIMHTSVSRVGRLLAVLFATIALAFASAGVASAQSWASWDHGSSYSSNGYDHGGGYDDDDDDDDDYDDDDNGW